MKEPLNLAVIMGSVRAGRLCDTITAWLVDEIGARGGLAVDVIDPARLVAAATDTAAAAAETADLSRRLDRADAFVVVTPEYNHGYPAALKHLIDSFKTEWRAKPVAFVSYGGVSGGLRAVEQLRLVFAELHAVTVRDTVSFANAWDQFEADGRLRDREPARERLATMLDRLAWWSTALSAARKSRPYDSPLSRAA
jgi:NAD(P)H-dependent FMN reductase